ncbi:hypothetical protein IFM89_037687 [Coptis chinensis]|uniref:Uncharacterized protein n=1 Tax=Coptis chinensis TaxID=261450 RepID=A0A835II55_9MAGN|nr:hypothetical protein IFM89_037687 [Coptis chinensis]
MNNNNTSSGCYDKSKVLDGKPLRTLAPLFPSPPNLSSQTSSPFVCAPPFGPVPNGYNPFYPFYNTNDQPQSQTPFQQQPPIQQIAPFGTTPPPRPRPPFGTAGPSSNKFKNKLVDGGQGNSCGREESVDNGWSDNM